MNQALAYTSNYTEGAKYQATKDLTITEITKLIRDEIKEKYPTKKGYKFSVIKEHYCAIRIYVKASPQALFVKKYAELSLSGDWQALYNYKDGYGWRERTYSEFGLKLLDDLKRIGEQYNFDDSDAMIDYFHNNYYLNVDIDGTGENQLLKQSL